MNRVSVISSDKKFKKFERKIKNTALKILKILKKASVSVEIYLINSQKMRFLNKKFRGKNKTTTILSFEESRNFISPPSKFRKIGEIYLNEETRDKKQETKLLVHGLLHLFGYNHQKKNDRIKMERLENLIII